MWLKQEAFLFLPFLKAWEFMTEVLASWFSVRMLFLACTQLHPHGRRERGLSRVSSCEDIATSWGMHTCDHIIIPAPGLISKDCHSGDRSFTSSLFGLRGEGARTKHSTYNIHTYLTSYRKEVFFNWKL